MGNCQAIDAATLVIQHPNGKVDRFYWPITAIELMKLNPGHYVALLLSTALCPSADQCSNTTIKQNPVRVTRIKLLRPTDTLVLGQVYKLITTQEVMKGLSAKKFAKMKKTQSDSAVKVETRRSEQEENQVTKQRRRTTRTASPANSAITARSRTWQPKLQSISEAGS
ncbi:hypothetical protein HS088_TW20G00466 [Tripterygium wilfordii]|uniref:DUF4228 domain-containing protein n=1 Tax=Tripterygium wilfordii TaxID=458696 RepID=A0A7J7C8L9_TRIWF|nr:uncharacterized protein LOC119987496 isoform X1 [Tripterygium wilfordii]KAF5730096.1 hypothetical protein HS088_TW20G00466 [Tripterygium wilfordii]